MIHQSQQPFPSHAVQRVQSFAKAWIPATNRPCVSEEMARHWEKLVEAWIDSSLPLYINEPGNNRGSVFQHRTGRLLVPSDDRPALWAYQLAISYRCPSRIEVEWLQREDRIPVARTLSPGERRRALYRCTDEVGLEPAGWHLRHARKLAIVDRQALDLPVRELENHFRLFMSPCNMFLVPNRYER